MRLLRAAAQRLRRLAKPPGDVCEPPPTHRSPFVDCASWRQGDVFAIDGVWTTGEDGQPLWVPTPDGVAVLSQSCDAAQPDRERIQVAPVVLLGGTLGVEAASGKRISYASLAGLGEGRFADLDVVGTLAKARLATTARVPGVVSDEQVRRFAGAISRKYGRFAFPDDVVRAVQPLRDVLRSKARKESSPLGQVLADVYGIRVEATGGWLRPPYDLVLIVIFEPGVLPDLAEDDALPEPAGLRARVLGPSGLVAERSSQIAGALQQASDPAERYWLVTMLSESWAARCEQAAVASGVERIVRSVTAEVVSVDEVPLSRVNNSEDLDLDYLSEPLPRLVRPPS